MPQPDRTGTLDRANRAACEFFLSNIYAPRDFSQRDHDLECIHKFLSHVLPVTTIQLFTATVELNHMTNTLDNRLLYVPVDPLSRDGLCHGERYAEAYRTCDNQAERVHQIDLTRNILRQVCEEARLLIVGVALNMAKVPAQRAGWVEIYDFLERGYQAARHLKHAKYFVETIARRETSLLDLIYVDNVAGFKKLAGLSQVIGRPGGPL